MGRSLEPFGRDWKGGLDWMRSGPGGCVALHGPPIFPVKSEGTQVPLLAGRAAPGTGASHSLSKLATPSECMLSVQTRHGCG